MEQKASRKSQAHFTTAFYTHNQPTPSPLMTLSHLLKAPHHQFRYVGEGGKVSNLGISTRSKLYKL